MPTSAHRPLQSTHLTLSEAVRLDFFIILSFRWVQMGYSCAGESEKKTF
jgi:hypothetical protein